MKAIIKVVDNGDIHQGYKVGDKIDVRFNAERRLYIDSRKWWFTIDQLEIMNENTDSIKDPIVQRVIDQFKERSEAGIKKYNTTLERNDLSTLQWLTHLQEELMDATLYIERLKQEYDNERKDTN